MAGQGLAAVTGRPDPLAPPEGYGERPQTPREAALAICSQLLAQTPDAGRVHCPSGVEFIVWIGCTQGEHAGPLGYCGVHARQALSVACDLICGQCQDARVKPPGGIRILRAERADGTMVAETFSGSERDQAAIQRALDMMTGR